MTSHGDDSADESREQHLHDADDGAPESDAQAPEDFESAWQAIVAHYDDQTVDDRAPDDQAPDDQMRLGAGGDTDRLPAVDPIVDELPFATPGADIDEALARPELHLGDALPVWSPAAVPDEETFVPPTIPPMPPTPLPRRLAWIAVLGAPAALLVLTIMRWRPPELISYGLLAAFVGAFGYLVATMRDEPRDPWDDGSRV